MSVIYDEISELFFVTKRLTESLTDNMRLHEYCGIFEEGDKNKKNSKSTIKRLLANFDY
jgi:hypothetical protein